MRVGWGWGWADIGPPSCRLPASPLPSFSPSALQRCSAKAGRAACFGTRQARLRVGGLEQSRDASMQLERHASERR